MRTKKPVTKAPAEQVVKDISRAMRKHCSAEHNVTIVLRGLLGEDCIAEIFCAQDNIFNVDPTLA